MDKDEVIIKKFNNKTYKFIFQNINELQNRINEEISINEKCSNDCETDTYYVFFCFIIFGFFSPMIIMTTSNFLNLPIWINILSVVASYLILLILGYYFCFRKHNFSDWNVANLIKVRKIYNELTNSDIERIYINKHDFAINFQNGKKYSYSIMCDYLSSEENIISIIFELDECNKDIIVALAKE